MEKSRPIIARVERAAIAAPLSDEAEVIKKAGIELRDIDAATEDEIIAKAKDADVVFIVRTAFTRRVFENLPKLRAVIRCGVGYDNVDVDAATDNKVLVVNVPDFCFEEVSNHAIVLLMACAKKLVRMNHLLKTAGWKLYIFKAKIDNFNDEEANRWSVAVIDGKGVPPINVVWDCLGKNQKLVKSGKYYFVLTAEDFNGQRFSTDWQKFSID